MAGGDMLTGHTRLPEPNQNAIRIVAVAGLEPAHSRAKNGPLALSLDQLSYTAMKKPHVSVGLKYQSFRLILIT